MAKIPPIAFSQCHGLESFLDIATWVSITGTNDDLSTFFCIAWDIWNRRNKIFKGKANNPVTDIERALALKICHEQVKITKIQTSSNFTWDPPPPGSNVDGAIFFNYEKAGVGCLLRDAQGDLIMAASSPEILAEPATIEALAILRGLQLSIHLELSNLIIKSDCLLLVEEVLQATPSSMVSNIVLEIKEVMSQIFGCSIQHCSQVKNELAHKLAMNSWSLDQFTVGIGFPRLYSTAVMVGETIL